MSFPWPNAGASSFKVERSTEVHAQRGTTSRGAELKENIKRQWWQSVVRGRDDVVGIDSSVILPRAVWEASGHVAVFTDPLIECTSCHKRYRQDTLQEEFEYKKGRAPSQWTKLVVQTAAKRESGLNLRTSPVC